MQFSWLDKDQPVVYLSVDLITGLTWKFHTLKKLDKKHAGMAQLYSLLNSKSPLNINVHYYCTNLWLGSQITYANQIWSLTSVTHIKKLQRWQSKIRRMAVNVPWYIKDAQLHCELNTPIFQEYIATLTKKNIQDLWTVIVRKCSIQNTGATRFILLSLSIYFSFFGY